MVQVLTDPTHTQHGDIVAENGAQEPQIMSREEHAQRMKDLNAKRAMMRAPRRGWSLTDHHVENTFSMYQYHHTTPQFDRQAPIPENAVLPPSSSPSPHATPAVATESSGSQTQLPRRPRMPPPRRSQSVTDKEPLPVDQPQVSPRLNLVDLPSELHYALFDVLDPIDGVCLGLAHSRLYTIHRRKYGTVPLSSRYSGPNDMEWAWRGAGALVRPSSPIASEKESHLGQMRVKGQVYCRKCGIARCELHRHLKEWMGDGYEYCEIKEVFGKLACEDAKPYCFMSSPKNPHRCGRHGGKQVRSK